VNNDTATSVQIPSDAIFSVGSGAITETVTTDHGTRVLDFTQDASNPSIYDLTNTSFDPSQGAGGGSASGQSGHSHWSGGYGWSGDGDGSGHSWGGGHGLGVSDPGGPMETSGASDSGGRCRPPAPAIREDRWTPPSLETHIAQMHASGGSLF
jgi:hypothetical protein